MCSILVGSKIIYLSVCMCVCETCVELSTMTSCPAVPAVTAYEQMSVFPHPQTQILRTLAHSLACNRLHLKLLLAVESRAPSE